MGEYVYNNRLKLEIKIGVMKKCFLRSPEELITLRDMGYEGKDCSNTIESYLNDTKTTYGEILTAVEAQDEAIRFLWEQLEDVTLVENEDNELVLASKWHLWGKNTPISDIWGWFDAYYSTGIHGLPHF